MNASVLKESTAQTPIQTSSQNTSVDTYTYLVVNKINTLRTLTSNALERAGYGNISEAHTHEEAEQVIESNTGGLIVIFELPLASSFYEASNFIEMLNHYKPKKEIKLIMTSLVVTHDLILILKEVGVTELVVKSYDVVKFSEKLDSAIKRVVRFEETTGS